MWVRGAVLVFIIPTLLLCFGCKQKSEQETNKTVLLSKKAQKIDELVGLYADYEGFNGAILVSHNGEIIYKNGFGFANMEWDIPNQSDTKFRIASITKPFTSVLIMQLVAEGKLDLHEPISTYLPDYPKKNGDQITLHHLLSHTSGTVRDYESDIPLNPFPGKQRPERLIQEFYDLPLEFTPGERFVYSNSGYMVLGYLIETVTGLSYETVLKNKILSPLGMVNTGIDKHRPLIKKRAKGYFKGFGDYFNANYIDMSNIPAVGNIYSTVEDLFLLDQALHTEKLVPKAYLDLMFTKHVADEEYDGHQGYGWELMHRQVGNTRDKVATIGHTGVIDGFCALFTRIPSSNSSIIFLNNTRKAFLNTMTTGITGILNDTTYDFPKKPLVKFMSEVIADKGITSGILFYKKHVDDDDYYSSEQELIVAGYRFLHAGNAKDAAAIFKLSIDVFPDRDNPYDSYAEALMTLGRNKEAIENYKKSLELNPNNGNAVAMLKKLENK